MTRYLTMIASIVALVSIQACAPKPKSSRLSPQDRALARGQAGKGTQPGTVPGAATQPGTAAVQSHPAAAGQACRLTEVSAPTATPTATSGTNGSATANSAAAQQIINAQIAYAKTIPPCDSIKVTVDNNGAIEIPQSLSLQEQGQAHAFAANEITQANGGTVYSFKSNANSNVLVLTYILPAGVTAAQAQSAQVRIEDADVNGGFVDIVPSRYVVETRGNQADIRITNPSNLILSLDYQVQIQIGGTAPAQQEPSVDRPSAGTPSAGTPPAGAAQNTAPGTPAAQSTAATTAPQESSVDKPGSGATSGN